MRLSRINNKFFLLLSVLFIASSVMNKTYAAGTPAGTKISSKALATYMYVGGIEVDTAYSDIVTFTVEQFASLNIIPITGTQTTQSDSIAVDYSFSIVNTGNGSDRFLLSASSSKVWFKGIYPDINRDGILQFNEEIAGPLTSTVPMTPDTSLSYIARIVVPHDPLLSGQIDSLFVRAVSTFNSGVKISGSYFTTVNAVQISNLSLTVDNASTSPGKTVEFTFSFTNSGSAPASNVIIRYPYSNNFTIQSATTPTGTVNTGINPVEWNIGSVGAGTSILVTVKARVGDSVAVGTIIDNTMNVNYTSGSHQYAVPSNTRQVIVNPDPSQIYGVTISPVLASASKASGDTVVYKFYAGNSGYNKDVLEIGVTSSEFLSWDFFRDSNKNGIFDAGDAKLGNSNAFSGIDADTVASKDSLAIFVRTVLPLVQFDQTVDQTVVTVSSAAKPALKKELQLTTSIGIPLVQMNVAVTGLPQYAPGDTVTYTITYQNNGHAIIDTFYIQNRIPLNTDYISGTVRVNGIVQQDNNVVIVESAETKLVKVNIGSLKPNQPGNITLRVRIR
jgi:uncharacterized repeat protein (TIGR01451 family)